MRAWLLTFFVVIRSNRWVIVTDHYKLRLYVRNADDVIKTVSFRETLFIKIPPLVVVIRKLYRTNVE